MLLSIVQLSNEARGFAARKAVGCMVRPRASGVRSMAEYDTEDDSSDVECPTCGRDDFKTVAGMKGHHKRIHGESIAGIEIQCVWCGETKRRRPNEVKRSGKLFCSTECRGNWDSEHYHGENHPNWEGGDVEVSCDWCGQTTEVRPVVANRKGHNFCSRQCTGAWRTEHLSGENHPLTTRVEVTCTNCGASKWAKQHVAEENTNHFCNYSCMGEWLSEYQSGEKHPSWEGGMFPYGTGWDKQKRELIRNRQNRHCASCGKHESENGRRLDVHHIQKARLFDDDEARNNESNLVALCRDCHREWERMSPLRPQTPYLD